jgi:ion channel-forming bestrophin family protein
MARIVHPMIDYDSHLWRSHLWDVKGSMLREITGRVLLCVIWAAIVVAIHRYLQPINVTAVAHSLIGVALGLLLVFRTNASYDRFWEGRKLWGGITNASRNLARLTRVALAKSPELRDQALRWTVTFAYAAMLTLRGKRGLGPLADRLPVKEVQEVMAAPHIPLAVAGQITQRWFAARDAGVLSDILLVALDQNVQTLIDHIGACERIHRTPLPFAYVVHLRRAILIYCYTLPFALVNDFGWYTPLCTLLIAYVLIGIEEIGVEIEDPFGMDDNDLPLERFCDNIRHQVLDTRRAPEDNVATPEPANQATQVLPQDPAHRNSTKRERRGR